MFKKIYEVVREDLGGRGFSDLADLSLGDQMTSAIMQSKRAVVLTGFPVASAGGIGETDGPSGAVNIAYALEMAGIKTTLATDQWSYDILCGTAKVLCPKVKVEKIETPSGIATLLNQETPDLIVTIERPSKAKDGHFHSMRGVIIDEFITDTDSIAEYQGAKVIAIGDGGNEYGMGSFTQNLPNVTEENELMFAVSTCDFPLLAGVSNWWSWGIQALISVKIGKNILNSDEKEAELVQAMIDAGSVDGITAKNEITVDNLSLEENLSILRKVRAILEDYV